MSFEPPPANFKDRHQSGNFTVEYGHLTSLPDNMETQVLDKCSECHAGNGKCRFQKFDCRRFHANVYVFLVGSVLAVACVLQFGWNLYLNEQLARVRYDVDILMQNTGNAFDYDLAEQNKEGRLYDQSHEQLLNFYPQSLDSPLPEKYESGLTSKHFQLQSHDKSYLRAKRSSGSEKKPSRKKRRRSKISRLLQKHKAIAIHVQAQRNTKSNVISPLNLPGRSLTGWKTPSSKYFGFDTSNLSSQGYISVPSNGLYFVYSQVVFLTSDVPHMVAEIGVNTRGLNTFTKCQFSRSADLSQRNGYVTCDSNGIVYLSKGEGISLIVNPPNVKVYMAPEYTYFGAFLIGL